jgi:acylglycerol lipase
MDEIQYRQDFFQTTDNLRLYEQSWRPSNLKAIVVIVHGYAEHSQRYAWVATQLVDRGFAVYTFDLRGHGKSEGERCFVESFDRYLTDLEVFLTRVKVKEPNHPIFLLSHSMGGTISSLFIIRQQPKLGGVILSSSFLGIGNHIPLILVRAMILIGRLLPKLPTLRLDSRGISRDPDRVRAYETDPLICHKPILARTLAEILKAISEINSRSNEIKLPLLILHGTGDRLVTMEGSKRLYAKAKSQNKSLKLYEGFYHELLNEPEKVEVVSVITIWLQKQLSAV